MKTFLSTFLAVLMATGLALFGYDRWVLEPRLRVAGEVARVSLDEARADAEGIARDFRDNVDRSVAEIRAAMDQQIAEDELRRELLEREAAVGRRRAEAAEALMRTNVFKLSVSEHFMSMGAWPESHAAAGLGDPGEHAGGPVASIELEADGVIAIHIRPELAERGLIRLIPAASGFSRIEWRCQASGYPPAATLPNCGE